MGRANWPAPLVFVRLLRHSRSLRAHRSRRSEPVRTSGGFTPPRVVHQSMSWEEAQALYSLSPCSFLHRASRTVPGDMGSLFILTPTAW